MVKKFVLIAVAITALSGLAGCSNIQRNNVNLTDIKTTVIDQSIQKMEVLNIYNDALLFADLKIKAYEQLSSLETSNESEEVKRTKCGIIVFDYMNDVSKIANSRVVSDIGTIYTNSEEYNNYIAMLQVYVDIYNDEKTELEQKFMTFEDSIQEMKSYQMFSTIEEYYADVLAEMDGNE